MKYFLTLLLVFSFIVSSAQRVKKPRPATPDSSSPAVKSKPAVKESPSYHEYRTKLTVPPYGLIRVKELIKKIKSDDEENLALGTKDYESLSFREKFTYHMIHAESYSQNCDAMPPLKNEDKKIFAFLPDAFNEFSWSERQTKFLSGNRDSVIAIMRESIGRTKRAGINFKQAMLEVNAREMIPDMITAFRANKMVKDLDLLTVMLQLMKDNEYEPFIISGSYKKLYADENNYQSYLNDNVANEELIIKRAMEFYNAEKK